MNVRIQNLLAAGVKHNSKALVVSERIFLQYQKTKILQRRLVRLPEVVYLFACCISISPCLSISLLLPTNAYIHKESSFYKD